MKSHVNHKQGFITILILFLALVSSKAQETTETINPIYVCIFDDDVSHIMKIFATEPIGLIFAEETNVIIYSSVNMPQVVDVMHIEPDTITGTYRRVGMVGTAYTTSNIASQGNCDENYAEFFNGLHHTILLPLLPNQAIAIHSPERSLYQDEQTAIIGSIGMLPIDALYDEEAVDNVSSEEEGAIVPNTKKIFPSFQLLRFSGGDSDKVSLEFPELEGETQFYTVSRQLVSYTLTNPAGDVSQTKIMETRPFFLALLNTQNISLVDDIMALGKFRIYIDFGEIITYRADHQLNFARLSSVTIREFEAETAIKPINCDYPVPYFRSSESESGYHSYIYFQTSRPSLGVIRCDGHTMVEETLANGILVVKNGNYVASWLVEPVPLATE